MLLLISRVVWAPWRPPQTPLGSLCRYSSGSENLHGVEAVRSGRRCLVTVWLSPETNKIEELPLAADSPFLAGRKRGEGRQHGPP